MGKFELGGVPFKAFTAYDDDTAAPWERSDGHGPVRTDLRESKRPGERVLGPTGSREREHKAQVVKAFL